MSDSINENNQYYKSPEEPKNDYSDANKKSSVSIEPPKMTKKMDIMAIVSLGLSISGLFLCLISTIPGIILGLISLNKIKNSKEPLDGKSFAIAGIIVGGILTLLSIIFILILVSIDFSNFRPFVR